MLLEGKVAIVSGIGPGMGRDISLKLAEHGADVVLGGGEPRRARRSPRRCRRSVGGRRS